jgi:hypothetical protein
MMRQKRPGNFGKLRQEKLSKDKSICFRKRPEFINENKFYDELSTPAAESENKESVIKIN